MSHSLKNCGILIVAAGQSKRLGSPKQLLMYEGKTLINRLIDIVKEAVDFPMALVLGAHAEKIKLQLSNPNMSIIINEHWVQGMGSSISIGLEGLMQKNPAIDGVMILVCDQPFLNREHILSLMDLQAKSDLPMAACYYAGVLGTPAVFHQSIFPELLALKGDMGAKNIINHRIQEVAKLQFDQGLLDIDTEEDYKKLMKEAE
jgi:molybdenum cofactor cytidylyltransferase